MPVTTKLFSEEFEDQVGKSAAEVYAEINQANDQLRYTATSCGRVVSKLNRGVWDINILVSSDSTGDATNEWVHKLGQWYASNWPEYTVNYYLWDTSGDNGYQDVDVISSGTGDYSINIYNFAIAGTTPDYIQGARFESAVAAIPAVDLFLVNHGHNIYLSGTWGQSRINETASIWLGMATQVLALHGGAGVVFHLQNPRRNTDAMDFIYTAVTQAAAIMGCDLADSASKFKGLGKADYLYADDIHPSSEGSDVILTSFTELHNSEVPRGVNSTLDELAYNLLPNGDFLAFDNLLPDGFTASDNSNTLVTKDTSIATEKGYSVKLESAAVGGGATWIQYQFSGDALKQLHGRVITLAVRVYIPSSSTGANAGRASLIAPSGTYSMTGSSEPRDGWAWRMTTMKVMPTDNYVRVRLFGDTTSNDNVAYFDKAVLAFGPLPKDCIPSV